jgi:prephenate dehydrogenase
VQIAFLGFGLIAGSTARALRTAADGRWRNARLAAWSPSGSGPLRALREGVIDIVGADPPSALDGADLVVLGAPPLEVLSLIDLLSGSLREVLPDGAVVTDVASTKVAIVERADAGGLRFVGGHPMAGREQAGYEASDGGLFAGRPWVIVPGRTAAASDVELVESLALACGAHPVRMSAEAHDDATAGISHLPLVAAVALVEAVVGTADRTDPGWAAARPLAAGGWRDMTRLARGDVTMGAGILATNARSIAERLRALRAVVDEWLAELERSGGPDPERLAGRLRAARDRLDSDGSAL